MSLKNLGTDKNERKGFFSAHKTLSKHFITSFVKFAGVNSVSKMTTRDKNPPQKKTSTQAGSVLSVNRVFRDPRPWISGITLSNAAEWELLANRLAPSQPPSSHVVIVRVRLGCSFFLPLSFASRDKLLPLSEEGNGARPHLPFGSSRAELRAKTDGKERPRLFTHGFCVSRHLVFFTPACMSESPPQVCCVVFV